ncbi:MAG: hypothetical protein ACXWCZ_11315 [Flavisolibacter sp.]
MKKIKIGNGMAIFILFFGISVIEAIRTADWRWIVLWVLIGLVFLLADNMRNKSNDQHFEN